MIELSELQLPTLSRGTTVAVYTNVTSDHLDRHGSLEGYRAAKRRLAELVDPAGRPDPQRRRPGRGRVRGPGNGAGRRSMARARPDRAASASMDGWIVARRRRDASCRSSELAIPGGHNVSNALAAVAVGLHFGLAPEAIRHGRRLRSRASSTASSGSRSSTASSSSTTRRGPSRTRSWRRCARSTRRSC